MTGAWPSGMQNYRSGPEARSQDATQRFGNQCYSHEAEHHDADEPGDLCGLQQQVHKGSERKLARGHGRSRRSSRDQDPVGTRTRLTGCRWQCPHHAQSEAVIVNMRLRRACQRTFQPVFIHC